MVDIHKSHSIEEQKYWNHDLRFGKMRERRPAEAVDSMDETLRRKLNRRVYQALRRRIWSQDDDQTLIEMRWKGARGVLDLGL